MSRALALSVVALALFATASAQYVPVPKHYDGFFMGQPTAPIMLEAYFDAMCPDSRASWPTLKEVIAHYGNETLLFGLHVFPLPYHHNSFYANQGLHVVSSYNKDPFTWLEAVFTNQETFGNPATINLTANQVIAKFASLAESSVGISALDFASGIASPALDEATRVSWKYGCSRTVSGTPMFFVNGVQVMAEPSWTLAQWTALIDPLLS